MVEPPRRLKKPLRTLSRSWVCIALLLSILTPVAHSDNARFDLIGPKIEVRVTRAGVTLPIASVPNLQVGDRIWLHPDLPSTQSVHYLLVLAFLRGTTNPPPDNWFIRIEAWDKKIREEGQEVTVPDGAQQAVLFLAPVTGGDFGTLRSAVQGRPGVFVRASQDLTLAGFEQGRIEKYIAAMGQLPPADLADPKTLQEDSNRIAGTLALKPNPDCFKQPPDQQYTCLTQSGGQTLLDDGHGQTIVDALTSGSSADLIGTAAYTQLAGGGLYSAYVGSIVDLIHIMGSLHTAQYQYIPAIAFPQQQSLNLRLNTAPSFHNPKSVLVIGLPSVQATVPPPLRPADPKLVSCLAKPGVVLPVEGAPLVYATGFAHDLILHINYPSKTDDYKPDNPKKNPQDSSKSDPSESDPAPPQDIPLTADALKGGLVLAPIPKRRALPAAKVELPTSSDAPPSPEPPQTNNQPATSNLQPATGNSLTGTVSGFWGFDTFTGPTLPLQTTPGKDWKLASDNPLIAGPGAGKEQHILLASTGAACIQTIALDPAIKTDKQPEQKETWKPGPGPDTVDVALNLSALLGVNTVPNPVPDPATLHLTIRQFDDAKPVTVNLISYSEPAKLGALEFHAGETTATLTGSSLEQVRQVEFAGATFTPQPAPPSQPGSNSTLRLALPTGAAAPTQPAGQKLTARVALEDGRTLTLPFVIDSARPSVTLIGKAEVPAEPDPDSKAKPRPAPTPRSALAIHLGSPDDLPLTEALLFSMKSVQPFPRAGKIEVASPDDSLHATLTVASETLILEDPRTILGKLEPLRLFGPSAFGPLRMRPIGPNGAAGDWLSLITLVRLPTLTGLSCPVAPTPLPASKLKPAPQTPPTPAPASATPPTSDLSAVSFPSPATGQPTISLATPPPPDNTNQQPATNSPQLATSNQQPATSSALAPCTLTGASLYLIDSIASDAAFTSPTRVPDGFVGSTLTVPAPTGAVLYLRLRDDPTAVNTITLPAGPL